MDKINIEEALKTLKEELRKMKDKDFNVYFFVLDSKGNPSATLAYIYDTALELQNLGYKVTMLHQEEDFIGVGEWLDELYANIPHQNIEKDNVAISPSDFLFIPEIYANVMSQTKQLPCKRVAILTNLNYLTEVIPVGVSWADMGIFDVVTTTKNNADIIRDYFPGIKCDVVSPAIPGYFRRNTKPQKLLINLLVKEPSDINKIVKPFIWKYPAYRWVSFADLRGVPRLNFSDALREGAITIWEDDETNFGTSLFEAIKSGSIVMAKIPSHIPDWMLDKEGNLLENVIWFDDVRKLPDIIASVVRAWLYDEVPEVLTNTEGKFNAFTKEQQKNEIKDVYVNSIFANRAKEIEEAIAHLKSENNKKESK